jgi:hypothetical protein
MALGYNPKTSSVSIEYVVKNANDPWFIPGNEERAFDDTDGDWLEVKWLACQLLSPKGVELVAT